MEPHPELSSDHPPAKQEVKPFAALLAAAIGPLFFLAVIWAVFILFGRNHAFKDWGIVPRTFEGLRGILTGPFVHADWDHLLSNTAPILVVGTVLVYFYRSITLRVIGMIWIFGGFWVWIMARPASHIGASGLIYGGVIFLFFSGIFRKDVRLMAVSFLVVFLYGSLAWGILPIDPAQSWESHLSGSIAGLFAAIYYRQEGPQRPKYNWELEEEHLTTEEPVSSEDSIQSPSSGSIEIRYDYKPSGQDLPDGKRV